MKKRKPIVLEYEYQALDFEETQILLWNTYYRNYEFANALNTIFRMKLAREENISVTLGQGKSMVDLFACPTYGFYDEFSRLLYYCVEIPQVEGLKKTLLGQYDKILFINGRDSIEKREFIFSDFQQYNEPVTIEDPRLLYHRMLVKDMAVNGVMTLDYLNLSDPITFDSSIMERLGMRYDEKFQKLSGELVRAIDVIMKTLSVRLMDSSIGCE